MAADPLRRSFRTTSPLARSSGPTTTAILAFRESASLSCLPTGLRAQRVLHPEARIAQALGKREHVRQVFLGDEGQKDIDAGDIRWSKSFVFEQFTQHDISHTKPDGRQSDTTYRVEKIVVPPATTYGPKRPATVEDLKHSPGVVGQSSYDPEIDLDKVR